MQCAGVLSVFVLVLVRAVVAQEAEDSLEDTVKTLKGQVSALLERRQEDYRLLEQSLRHSLEKSSELSSLKAELENLRQDVRTTTERKNEHLTTQWVTASVSELRAELLELARAHNESAARAARNDLRAQLRLARADGASLRRELERLRADHAQVAAELAQTRQELGTARTQQQDAAKRTADTRHLVLGLQSEWNVMRKSLKKASATPAHEAADEDNRVPVDHPALDVLRLEHEAPLRHHHLVKAQLSQLSATTRALKEDNAQLRKQLHRLEKHFRSAAMRLRQERVADDALPEASELLQRVAALENNSRSLSQSVWNVSRQVAGFSALRGSTLQLLESLESLESKVDASVPAVQREISRLEFSLAQVRAVAHENKEDQQNQRASLKAVASSVSNLQDRTATDHTLASVLEHQMVNATERLDALELAVSYLTRRTPGASRAPPTAVQAAGVSQVADEPTLPRLVDELSHVQADYENILHKLPRDCSTVRGDSGEYLVSADGVGAPLMVPCDQRTERGGWTVIQRRADGSQNFNRKWDEYGVGFGVLTGEFWLGNSALHRLTADGCMELRVELGDIYGQHWLAEYDAFLVGTKEDGYRLTVSGYRGNASDALNYQTGMQFSAPDSDRDNSHTHCAQNYEGGWWFSHCQHANLNGRYNLGLTWFQADRNEWIAVATSELKIRRKPGCVARPLAANTSTTTIAPSSTTTTTTQQSTSESSTVSL